AGSGGECSDGRKLVGGGAARRGAIHFERESHTGVADAGARKAQRGSGSVLGHGKTQALISAAGGHEQSGAEPAGAGIRGGCVSVNVAAGAGYGEPGTVDAKGGDAG